MYYSDQAAPPSPSADAASYATTGPQEACLTSADGAEFRADYSLARRLYDVGSAGAADAAEKPAVIILPNVRRLFTFYRDLTDAFACTGHPAIAIDYFGRC